MRSDGIHSPAHFIGRAAALVILFGLGCTLISYRGRFDPSKSENENQRAANGRRVDAAMRSSLIQSFQARPLIFEPNQGQSDRQVKFQARGGGYMLFLTPTEAVFALNKQHSKAVDQKSKVTERADPAVLRMHLARANRAPSVTGVDELEGKTNYFIGNDPAQWHTNIPNFARVKYEHLYPGVDLVFYGNQRQLEFDFVVAPGADPGNIRLNLDTDRPEDKRNPGGSASFGFQNSRITIDSDGNLVIPTGAGDVVFRKPLVYQDQNIRSYAQQQSTNNGIRTALVGRYVLAADGSVGFEIPNYDRSKRLIIDPAVTPSFTYSSFLGGSSDDDGAGIAVDSNFNAYVVGQTFSFNFPIAAPFSTPLPGGGTCRSCGTNQGTAFVTKINPSGTNIVYSSFLGGNQTDAASAITLDAAGDAYVVGSTNSANFPHTPNAVQPSCKSCGTTGQPTAFVTEFNPSGSALVFSTFLGGSFTDQAAGLTLDANNNIYVTGTAFSPDFPVTPNAFQTTCSGGCAAADAFVTIYTPAGVSMSYSTFLGGTRFDTGHAIAVDASGDVYITGGTQSVDFPFFEGEQMSLAGTQNAFVTKLNPKNSGPGALIYSTFLGGSKTDVGNGIAVDSSDNIYVTGSTSSSNFPTVNPFTSSLQGTQNAFVTKVDHTGALDFSSFLGGSGSDSGNGIALDASTNCYIVGNTTSTNFPTTNPITINGQSSPKTSSLLGAQAAFVTKINPLFYTAVFSSYLGGGASSSTSGNGIAVDSNRNAYVTGRTTATDFPIAGPPFQPQFGGGNSDAYVSAITGLVLPAITVSPTTVMFPDTPVQSSSTATVTVTNPGDAALNFTSFVTATTSGSTSEFSISANNCGATLAPSASCMVTLQFSPAASGAQSGTLTITDNAAASPQQLFLTGNGTQAILQLNSNLLSFGNQGVTTTSSALSLTVSNTGNAPMTITSVTVTPSDYSLSVNTCPAPPDVLRVGANCQVSVTFTPSTSGQITGTLTFTDNASGSPQAVTLVGSGIVAFNLSAPNGGTQTVTRNETTASFTVTAGSQFNYTGPIALQCSGTGLVSCSVNPTSIFPGQTSTVTLTNLNFSGDTLSFTVTGANGNQVFSLGLELLFTDFGMAVSPSSETVNAGQTATYTLTFVPVNNFTGTVNFSCLGVPASISCTVNPASVTSNGTQTLTPIITLATTARGSTGPSPGPRINPPRLEQPPPNRWLLWLMVFLLGAGVAASQRRRARFGLAFTVVFVLLWAACTVANNVSNGTQPGNYGILIEGQTNNGTLKHAATLVLTVN